jgi:phosphoribosyl 1,2-cyclic phosphodiesterase
MNVCTLISGSWGNSIYLETPTTKVLVDAGQSGKKISLALEECGVNPADLDALLVTHSHRDHVQGVGVMARRYRLPVYATEGTWLEMDQIGPLQPDQQRVIETEDSWEVGDLKIESYPTSHDALDSVGFVMTKGKKSVGIVTDSGVFTARMRKNLMNMDCLILEANHDPDLLDRGRYPWPLKKRIASVTGHLSNEMAGEALAKIKGEKTRTVVLAHLSEENNSPGLARKTVCETLAKNDVELGDIDIFIAPRYKRGPWISL